MTFLVIVATVLAFCAGSAIPLVPGDNSHYVEGESRYIGMPSGEGVPYLVDLQEAVDQQLLRSRNGASNQYWLFTRDNPETPQIIVHGDINSIWNSNYDAKRPMRVLVHGWNSDGNALMNPLITSAFLAVEDCNVIIVDWGHVAKNLYSAAFRGVPSVGQFLGTFLVWLFNTTGADWNNMHMVGFSLGAHVVGYAGRTTGSRPGRVTGLDPAAALWDSNSNGLGYSDGQYVETIHTDGGNLGIFHQIADADFYPNGGRNPQPGCWLSSCSHRRAVVLFASSVRFNHLIGRQCSDINQVTNPNLCTGGFLMMGNAIQNKRGSGIYGLTTGVSWPF